MGYFLFIFSLYLCSSISLSLFNAPAKPNQLVNNTVLKICAITPKSSSNVGTVDIQFGHSVLSIKRLIFGAGQMSWLRNLNM
jgi:hypothetical protein